MSRLPNSAVDIAVPELRLESRLREFEQRLTEIESGGHDPWHVIGASGEVAFASGWRPYPGGTPGDFFSPAYRRVNGVVYIRGTVEKTSAPVVGELIFPLPVGWRPGSAQAHIFTTQGSSGLGRVDVAGSDGGVRYRAGGASWLSLDGMTFLAS